MWHDDVCDTHMRHTRTSRARATVARSLALALALDLAPSPLAPSPTLSRSVPRARDRIRSGRVGSDRRTPQDAGPFFHRNFISRNIGIEKNTPWLPIPDPKPTPAWLGGSMRWRRVIKKKLFFSTAAAPAREPRRQSSVRFCSMPNPPQAGGGIDDRGSLCTAEARTSNSPSSMRPRENEPHEEAGALRMRLLALLGQISRDRAFGRFVGGLARKALSRASGKPRRVLRPRPQPSRRRGREASARRCDRRCAWRRALKRGAWPCRPRRRPRAAQ